MRFLYGRNEKISGRTRLTVIIKRISSIIWQWKTNGRWVRKLLGLRPRAGKRSVGHSKVGHGKYKPFLSEATGGL